MICKGQQSPTGSFLAPLAPLRGEGQGVRGLLLRFATDAMVGIDCRSWEIVALSRHNLRVHPLTPRPPLPETGRGEPIGMGGLRREVPDLVVAGPIDSEYARRMISMAQELGVSNRVHFPGMLSGDAKWGAFYGCEAFILPSHQENFGIVLLMKTLLGIKNGIKYLM